MAFMTPLRRIREHRGLHALEAELAALRDEAAKLLESQIDARNQARNDRQSGEHQSNSKPEPLPDFEPASKEEGREVEPLPEPLASGPEPASSEPYPLGMVIEACPDVLDYAPAGRVRSWNAFMAAAVAIRPMLGISPDAWANAQEALGRMEAHVAMAVILQRAIHSAEAESSPGGGATVSGSPAIRSAGGYLRSLTDKARAGEFALGPVLMATMGQRLKARRRGPGAAEEGARQASEG
jgi:replication initiation protein RepC